MLRKFGLALLVAYCAVLGSEALAEPWPVKVVIAATYEPGNDTGDKAGELQLWVEREKLTERLEFPGGRHHLLTNKDHSIVAMVTGVGLADAGPSIMALAFDKRFDVRKAYWLVPGIAGVDPQVGSIGDAAWADFVVNDYANLVDMREAPQDWPYGTWAFGSKSPLSPREKKSISLGAEAIVGLYGEVTPLNKGLTEWAYNLTKDVKLDYTPELAAAKNDWVDYPKAAQPPKVFIGTSLSSNRYWHGQADTRWARDWVKMFTQGQGVFAMTNTEDASIAEAIVRLDRMGLADRNRLMVLRTASNYTMPKRGQTVYESRNQPYPGLGLPAIEAAYRVGSKVVHEIADNWSKYADQVPGAR